MCWTEILLSAYGTNEVFHEYVLAIKRIWASLESLFGALMAHGNSLISTFEQFESDWAKFNSRHAMKDTEEIQVCVCVFVFFSWVIYQLLVPASPRGRPPCRASDGSGSLSGWWGLQAAPPGPCGSARSCGSPRPRASPPSQACPGLMKVSEKTKEFDAAQE